LTAEKQRFGSRVIRNVELKVVPAGNAVEIRGRMDSVSASATVALSSDWIVHVWSRGLAVVDGALVMEVLGPGTQAPGSVAVRAVRWQPREPGVAEPKLVAAEAIPADGGWGLLLAEPS